VDDTVQGIIKCIFEEKSRNNIFNIASFPEEEISIGELANKIWHLMKGPDSNPNFNYIPYSNFGKYEDVLRRVPDITKIQTELGYKPVFKLETGLELTIDWQKSLFKKIAQSN
jgi:nucleoside-diphosphate-sugar epimerase